MGWHLLCACPRPHWGNEAVSVCCSGRLCAPFIIVRAQKHTERVVSGGLCCPICPALDFTATGPTWRVPRPGPIHLHRCLSGTDSLCVGSLQPPRYVSALLTGAWVRLLTRQWREIQVRQCLTGLQPTHAPASPSCVFVDSGLIFDSRKLGLTPACPLSPQIYCQTVTRGVLLLSWSSVLYLSSYSTMSSHLHDPLIHFLNENCEFSLFEN